MPGTTTGGTWTVNLPVTNQGSTHLFIENLVGLINEDAEFLFARDPGNDTGTLSLQTKGGRLQLISITHVELDTFEAMKEILISTGWNPDGLWKMCNYSQA